MNVKHSINGVNIFNLDSRYVITNILTRTRNPNGFKMFETPTAVMLLKNSNYKCIHSTHAFD